MVSKYLPNEGIYVQNYVKGNPLSKTAQTITETATDYTILYEALGLAILGHELHLA